MINESVCPGETVRNPSKFQHDNALLSTVGSTKNSFQLNVDPLQVVLKAKLIQYMQNIFQSLQVMKIYVLVDTKQKTIAWWPNDYLAKTKVHKKIKT
jgi:hypothetical protein